MPSLCIYIAYGAVSPLLVYLYRGLLTLALTLSASRENGTESTFGPVSLPEIRTPAPLRSRGDS